jgi:REP element-mobilizing transposase RayT
MVRAEFAEEYFHWYPKSKVFWGRQKFAVSCGGAPLEIVQQYVSAHPQG